MNIQSINIPYPDFKLQEIIDPEQFDLNNKSMADKITEILTVLNQITESVANGASGADKISLTNISPFISTKLQSFLKEVVSRLISTTDSASGADFIASTSITGLSGNTVQSQLESIKTLFDSLNTQVNTNVYTKTDTYSKQEVNTMASLKTSSIVDGGSFLDTYGSQSGVIDGGGF